MIQLNVSGRGFVRIDSWDDIESIAGFTTNLDASKNERLREVIGVYDLGVKIRCGLSNCHTLHNKGYIVETESGAVTNIGNVCGKRIFDVDFKQKKRVFDRDLADSNNREKISAFKSQLEGYFSRLSNLLEGDFGANVLERKLRAFKGSSYKLPRAVHQFLSQALRTKDFSIYKERIATPAEVELEEISIGRNVVVN